MSERVSKLAWFGWVIVILLFCLGADCCDPLHKQKQEMTTEAEVLAKVCVDRGGVPTFEDWTRDDDGHPWRKFKECQFPPAAAQLKGEGGK